MGFYRLLAKVFPRAFRRRYEEELEAAAAELIRTEGTRGRLHRLRLWIGLSTDAVVRGLAERRAERVTTRRVTARSLAAEWRQALRGLAARPGFVAVIIALLAITMGANAAVFGVVNATLLRPLPFADPERLVLLWESYAPMHLDTMPWSDPDYVSVRAATSFSHTAIFRSRRLVLTGRGEPAIVRAAVVEGTLFSLLGARADRGRLFGSDDSQSGRDDLAVLSYASWASRFGADAEIVGKTLVFDNEPHTVVGVLPRGFSFPPPITFSGQMMSPEPEVYLPYEIDTAAESRGSHNSFAVARLRPGVSLDAARAEIGSIAAHIQREFPDTNSDVQMTVISLHGQSVAAIRTVLVVLLVAVAGVLLIACASISNLILARASARGHEMALRAALGASRASLVRQLLFESLVLGTAGTMLGLVAAEWASSRLVALNPIELPGMFQSSLDWRVLGFSAVMTLAAVFTFGLLPALRGSRTDLLSMLRSGARVTAGLSERRIKASLVVVQVSLALVLLVGSGLAVRSLMRLWNVDPGFRSEGVTCVAIGLPQTRYADEATQRDLTDRLLTRVRQISSVTRAAAVTILPFAFNRNSSDYSVVGAPARKQGDYLFANQQRMSAGYIEALGMHIIEGRALTDADVSGRPLVVLVSESLALRHWPAGRAVGHQLLLGAREGEVPKTIVGVVSDVRMDGFDGRIDPTIYLPLSQSPAPAFWTVVTSTRSADELASELRAAVHDVDPGLPVDKVRSLGDIMGDRVKKPRFTALLLSAFAGVALLIAAVGLYGVLAFDVAQQRRELGIRVALGASSGGIRRLVLVRAIRLVAMGLLIGSAGALAALPFMQELLFNLQAADGLAFFIAAGVLAVTAALATWLPARRATRADPMEALRSQ